MLRAGLNSAAATSTPAGIFEVDDRCRIDQSRIADLVLVDDYLAGRFLSDREVYLQVDPSGGEPALGAVCRQGYLGDSPPGDAIAAALPKHPTAGRTHTRSTAPPPISPLSPASHR